MTENHGTESEQTNFEQLAKSQEYAFEGEVRLPERTLLGTVDVERNGRHTYFSFYDDDGEPAEEPASSDSTGDDSTDFSFEKED